MATLDDDLWLWLDLETTGSDPERDSIIEIGCILTTPNLEEPPDATWAYFQSPVRPTDEALGRLYHNPTVRKMHEDNGLLPSLHDAHLPAPHDVARRLDRWLNRCGAKPGRVVLAGSGVGHFDRRFLDRWMPQIGKQWLRYWCIDVGVIRRALEVWDVPRPAELTPNKPHRALADAQIHLNEARGFRDLLLTVTTTADL